MVAGVNRLVVRVGRPRRLPSELFIIAGAFAPGRVLNSESLAYVANCYNELHLVGQAGGQQVPGIISPIEPLGSRSRGPRKVDPTRFGLQPHRIGASPNVLHPDESPLPDCCLRGAAAAQPLLVLHALPTIWDPKCGGSVLA